MLKSVIVSALIALAASTAASATTYDAFTSFNGTNPVNRFAYYSNNVAMIPPPVECGRLAGFTCLQTSAGTSGPGFYKSQTNFTLSSDGGINNLHVVNTLLLASVDNPGEGVFFVAPTAGTYFIDALFNAQDDLATGVTITGVQRLGVVFSLNPVGSVNFIPSNTTFSRTVTLGAGDIYGFTFNPGANANHDLTGFSFTVRDAVPEPATWLTMLLGFGVAGLALRRRPRVTVTS